MICYGYFGFSEDSGKTDSDLDEPWIMTVRGPNSMKSLLNSSSESNIASPSQLPKKNQQNGSLQPKKLSSQKSNSVESNVSIKYIYFFNFVQINC